MARRIWPNRGDGDFEWESSEPGCQVARVARILQGGFISNLFSSARIRSQVFSGYSGYSGNQAIRLP